MCRRPSLGDKVRRAGFFRGPEDRAVSAAGPDLPCPEGGRPMNDRTYDRLLRFFIVTFIGAHITFAAFPGIDIAVSRGFVDVRGVFHASEGPTQILNDMLRAVGSLLCSTWCWHRA